MTKVQYDKNSINLLWIWNKKQNEKIEKPQAVHQDVLDSAIELADIHKDITNIWYDSSQCLPEAIINSKELLNEKISENNIQYIVQFKDIMTIPAYAQNIKMLRVLGPLYGIIDIAKILILLDELVENNRGGVVFIDKDKCLLHNRDNKIEIWNQDSKKKLKESGIILSDYRDNKYFQVANNEYIIKALKMAVDSSLIISTNLINNKFNIESAELKYNASKISGSVATLSCIWVPKYFQALKSKTMTIRADLVGEGTQDQTVLYDPDRHDPELRGNFFSNRTQDIMYWPKDMSIKDATRPFVQLGLAKATEAASISINMRLGCDHIPSNCEYKAVLWNEANTHISDEGTEVSGEVKIENHNF